MGAFFSKLFSKEVKSAPPFISPLLTDATVTKPRLGEQPSLYECALMSYLAYDSVETQKKLWSDDYRARNYLAQKGWVLHKEATEDDGGYCASVLINHITKQIAILYRGTDPMKIGTLAADADLVSNKVTTQQAAAEAFTRDILDKLKTQTNPVIVSSELNAYQLWFVGHSLGGWLAQTSASRFQASYHAMAVAFDSPGAADMIDKTQGSGCNIASMGFSTEQLRDLPITNVLSAPNIVNTCGVKIGRVYRTFVIPEKQSDIKAWFTFHFQQHSITNILNSFDNVTGIPKKSLKMVYRWPKVEWDKIGNGAKMIVTGILSTLTGNYTGLISVVTGIRDMFEGDEQKRNYYSFTNDLSSEPTMADLDYKQQYRLQCVAQYEAQEIDPNTFDVRYIHPQVRQFLEDFLAYGEAIVIDNTVAIPNALKTHLFAYEKVQGSPTGYRIRHDKLAAITAVDFLNDIHHQIYALGENLKPLLTKLNEWRNMNHATKFQHIEQRLKDLEEKSSEYQFLATQANQIIYQLLVQYYKDKTTIQCLFVDKKFDIDGHFINLSIIDKESFSTHEQKLKTDKAAFENLYQSDENLDLYNLFPSNLEKEDYRVLLTARAGTGKTTTCKYMVRQWAEGKLWQNQFDFIFWVPLRNITAQKYPGHIDLLDVVLKECLMGLDSKFNFDKDLKLIEVVKNKILHHGEKILWILDGYDEVAQISMEESSTYIETFIHEVLLQQPRYLLTSRPYYLPYHKLKLKKELVILGFSDTNVYQYIDKFFPTENQHASATENTPKKAQMCNLLHSNTSLLDLVTTPIYLEILCSVIDQDACANVSKRPTIAQLYNQLLYGQIKRNPILALGAKANSSSAAMLYANEKVADPLHCLMYIAHETYKQQAVVIDEAKISEATQDFQQADNSLPMIDQMLPFGFIKGITAPGIEQQNETKKSYYFIHLTFAEYFSALEMARSLINEDERIETQKFITQHKYNPRYESIFGFIAGILIDEQNSIYANFNATQVTGPRRRQLITERRNAVLMNLLVCLEEETPTNNWTHISVLMRYWQEVGQKNISEALKQRRQDFINKLKNLLTHNQIGQHFELHYHIVRFLRTNPGILDEKDINLALIQPCAPTLQTVYMLRTLYKLAQSDSQNDIRAQVVTLQTSTTPSLRLAAEITDLLILHINNPQVHQIVQTKLSEQVIAATYPWHVMLLELRHLHIQYPDENYPEKIANTLISHIKPDNAQNSDIIAKVLHLTKEFHETAALVETKVLPHLINMLSKNEIASSQVIWNLIYRCLLTLNSRARDEIVQKHLANMLEKTEMDPTQSLIHHSYTLFRFLELMPPTPQYRYLGQLNSALAQMSAINQWVVMSRLRQSENAPTAMQEITTNKIIHSFDELMHSIEHAIPARSDRYHIAVHSTLDSVNIEIHRCNDWCPDWSYFQLFLYLLSDNSNQSSKSETHTFNVSESFLGLIKEKKILFDRNNVLILKNLLLIDKLVLLDAIEYPVDHILSGVTYFGKPFSIKDTQRVKMFLDPDPRRETRCFGDRFLYIRTLTCCLHFILPVANKILLNEPVTYAELQFFQSLYVKILQLIRLLNINTFERCAILPCFSDLEETRFFNATLLHQKFSISAIAAHYTVSFDHHPDPRDNNFIIQDSVFLFEHIVQHYYQYQPRYIRILRENSKLLRHTPMSFFENLLGSLSSRLTGYISENPNIIFSMLDIIVTLKQEYIWNDQLNLLSGSNLLPQGHCSREYVRAVQSLIWITINHRHTQDTKNILNLTVNFNQKFIQSLQLRLAAGGIFHDTLPALPDWIKTSPAQLINIVLVMLRKNSHKNALQQLATTSESWQAAALIQILLTIYEDEKLRAPFIHDHRRITRDRIFKNLLALARLNNDIIFSLANSSIRWEFSSNTAEFFSAWADAAYYLSETMHIWLCRTLGNYNIKHAINQHESYTVTHPNYNRHHGIYQNKDYTISHLSSINAIYLALPSDNAKREFIAFNEGAQWNPPDDSNVVLRQKILVSYFPNANNAPADPINIQTLIAQAQQGKIGAQAKLIRHLVQHRAIIVQDDKQLKIEISKETVVIDFSDAAAATKFSRWIQNNLNLTRLYTTAAHTIAHAWHHKKNRSKPTAASSSSTQQLSLKT